MPSKDELIVELSEGEVAIVRRYAELRQMTIEEAASHLVSSQLEQRMRKKARRSPAGNVLKFRKKNGQTGQ